MRLIQTEVVQPLRLNASEDLTIGFRGSADRLQLAISTMAANFSIAVLILFLLMAAMFKSVPASALVILTMPMSLLGGVIGLRLLNLVTFQALDLLTMIGFIILLGLVVNNAILLVEQYRSNLQDGLDVNAAIAAAILVRARPIYMSTLTSIVGMLPLMLVPGVGTEIYRGLATVIVGGMTFSAIFTLLLMPSLLRLSTWRFTTAATTTTTATKTGVLNYENL